MLIIQSNLVTSNRLHTLWCLIILLLLFSMSPLCHSATLSNNDISQTVGENGVRIGLTLQQYEAGLKRREKALEIRFVQAQPLDRQYLETQLHVIQTHLQDAEQSYQTHIKNLISRITQLATIHGQISDDLLTQTQQALANGDVQQVDRLLFQMETLADKTDKVTAEAAYQRCQIAQDEIRYRQAFTLCQRAVQLVPDQPHYLSSLADLAHLLGEHRKAAQYYQQALTNDIKIYGEDHPIVALHRNNLGAAWDALGEYKKAIINYEQALSSDLKVYGEYHSNIAISRNNLAMAWHELGEYEKAIDYLQLALASDLKTYGQDHLQVASYYNNLGGAWYALGEYKKANDYLQQALAGFEKVLGVNHPNTQGVRANYQQLQRMMKQDN